MLGQGWEVEDLSSLPGLAAAEETGETFEANATLKALHVSAAAPEALVLSDDSGLEVDALGGQPGVWSARYAGVNATDADNREKMKHELAGVISRGAPPPFTGRFRCVMVLAQGGNALGSFSGAVEGTLLTHEQGEGGFGYDPLFVPTGYDVSFGVLPAEVKNRLSHRAQALKQVIEWLKTENF